jgi:hypothetical protein
MYSISYTSTPWIQEVKKVLIPKGHFFIKRFEGIHYKYNLEEQFEVDRQKLQIVNFNSYMHS